MARHELDGPYSTEWSQRFARLFIEGAQALGYDDPYSAGPPFPEELQDLYDSLTAQILRERCTPEFLSILMSDTEERSSRPDRDGRSLRSLQNIAREIRRLQRYERQLGPSPEVATTTTHMPAARPRSPHAGRGPPGNEDDDDPHLADRLGPATRFHWQRLIVECPWLKATEVTVALVLSLRMDPEGKNARPSVKTTLTRQVKRHRSKIIPALKRLVSTGWLTKQERVGLPTIYDAAFPGTLLAWLLGEFETKSLDADYKLDYAAAPFDEAAPPGVFDGEGRPLGGSTSGHPDSLLATPGVSERDPRCRKERPEVIHEVVQQASQQAERIARTNAWEPVKRDYCIACGRLTQVDGYNHCEKHASEDTA